MRRTAVALAGLLLPLVTLAVPHGASAAEPDSTPVQEQLTVTASDGVALQTTLSSTGPLQPRPTVVEFSPYGRDSGTLDPGPDYNTLLVQIRGTGDSDGSFDALGPRSQADVAEVLRWACDQPWSAGRLAINGFSASAIIIYNSLHQQLPCVQAAVLRSGTFELYRDLLVPGGVSNLVPGIGVLALIGAPALMQAGDRIDDPASGLEVLSGLFTSGLNAGLLHPNLDTWWAQRGFRGDVNHLPVLMINGFFDVESRGAFQAFQELRDDGAHLLMVGGHDGAPVGTDDGVGEARAWLDHFVRGVDNGVEQHPTVQLLMSRGDREDYLAGDYSTYAGDDWPLPGTTWADLRLSATRSGTATSLNDGTLTLTPPLLAKTQSYPAVPSIPTMSDPPNAAIVGGMGLNQLTTALPILSDMTLAEPLGLTYTTAPLAQDVWSAGPLNLDLTLSTTAPKTAIWAVLSDVSPDGTAHPLTVGRLDSSHPGVIGSKSLHDDQGRIVQPYGDYTHTALTLPLLPRRYQVELWPVGNRFEKGHRIRLEILGESAASMPYLPGINSIRVGGSSGARLLFPVLPGSDLRAALGE